MYPFIIRSVAVLINISLFSLGCSSNPTVAYSPIANSTSTLQSVVHESPPIAAIPKVSENLLSAEQLMQLKQLGIKVVLPTYLPAGFQVTYFEAHRQKRPEDITDSAYYRISYANANNICIEVGSGYQAVWITNPSKSELETALGDIEITYGKLRRSETMQYWASIKKGGQVIYTGGKLSGVSETCNPLSLKDFTKVLKSLTVLE
ncbi:MAG: hypothetical protein ACK5L4_10555 [Pseudanabaena sp.]|jgi:hypothetical protein